MKPLVFCAALTLAVAVGAGADDVPYFDRDGAPGFLTRDPVTGEWADLEVRAPEPRRGAPATDPTDRRFDPTEQWDDDADDK